VFWQLEKENKKFFKIAAKNSNPLGAIAECSGNAVSNVFPLFLLLLVATEKD
jgi:hypothetical protein